MKLIFVSLVVLSVCGLIDCGSYMERDGYIYYLSYPLKLNWHRALRFCTYYGMYLEDIPHEEENSRVLQVIDFFKRNITTTVMDIWLSGSELGSEGQYFWEHTGHPVQYTAFMDGEPNNADNDQDCLALWKQDNYAWCDQNCLVQHYFICRDKMIIPEYLKDQHRRNCTDFGKTLEEYN